MEVYEMEALIENLWMKNKESWEQARTISYVTAQCQSTKQLDMKSMMPFAWEKEVKQEITQEERDQMWKEMKEMEDRLNKK